MSVRQYCHDNALALSTYRYRLAKHRRSIGTMPAAAEAAKGSASFIAIGSQSVPSIASDVEIALCGGITLRLAGASAERVLARVLERLA